MLKLLKWVIVLSSEKTILITGSTGKIGSRLTKHFLEIGFTVVFTSRSKNSIESLLKRFDLYYSQGKLYGVVVDLEDERSTEQIINFFNTKSIWPDSLINNARNRDYLKVNSNSMPTRTEWMGEILMDVVVPYELSMALVRHKDSEVRNVVNMASLYGIVPPNPNLYKHSESGSPIQYGVAKAALIHLTKELAVRLADNGVRVNSISFGGIEDYVSDEFKEKYVKLCPTGRMLKIHEIMGAVEFLISDMSAGMTGHNLVVDGGWSVW